LSGPHWTCPVHSRLDLSGTWQFCFQTLVNLLTSCRSCPSQVINHYPISLISGWTLIARKGPSTGKMWSGPPSRVTSAMHLWFVGLLLIQVTILLTPVMRMRKTVRCLSGMNLLNGPPTWPSNIPRRQSRAQSMTIVKPLCVKVASNPVILGFGLFSTLIGTILYISIRRG
jgi:hypothetical protein